MATWVAVALIVAQALFRGVLVARSWFFVDDHFFLAFNAHHEPLDFTLPSSDYAQAWTVVLDTAEMGEVQPTEVKPGDTVHVDARAIVVLRAPAL